MATVSLVGSTGLVGSQILSILLNSPSIQTVHAFARKALTQHTKLHTIQAPDPPEWPSHLPPNTSVFFSALGTTARAAGGFANQKKIDYDLNLALAEAAKKKGIRVYVLISTAGADPSSMLPYAKMKGELDEAVKALDFERTIIIKPGLLVGERRDSRPGEFAARTVASWLGRVSDNRLKDVWAQDADVVAKAALAAALEALDGESTERVRVLNQSDVVRLGRTEWCKRETLAASVDDEAHS